MLSIKLTITIINTMVLKFKQIYKLVITNGINSVFKKASETLDKKKLN